MSFRTTCLLVVLASRATSAEPAPQHGIEVGDLDRKIGPCTDFYDFANGTWRASNPIPPSMVRWSRRWASGELSKDQLKTLLDEVSQRRDWPAGSVEQLISDHYGACMDEGRVDQLGSTPLQALFAEIDAIRSPSGIQPVIVHLHGLAVPVPFALSSAPDNHDPTRVIADVSASGLGLPDRDYYLKPERRFVEAREKYRAHVARMFALVGSGEGASKAAAETVFAFETALARASLDNVSLRDPYQTDHPTSFAKLQRLAPSFDWKAYFATAGLPRADLNVQEPKFLQEFDRQLQQTSLARWKTYLKWQLLNSAASSLSTALVTEHFEFDDHYLGGAKEQKPRWKRCVESTDALLGEALGRKYVERYFPSEAKARMQEMVKNILLAMGDTIRALTWMGPETKQKALEKLSTFNPKIGYPDRWKDYGAVKIRRDAFWADVVAGRRFNVEDDRGTIGKPVDRGRWGMTPPTSNAYYNPLLNEIVFPAGVLQPPGFSMQASDPVNYGGIGVVIGHEVSHGFDDQGARYDAQGRLKNWWSVEDNARFAQRTECVVDQFDHYFIEPNIHHNGKLVLGESIGDLAGAKVAFLALKKALQAKAAPSIDGFTPEQQFFIAYGQWRGDATRPETQRRMVQGDPHPIAKFRVIGPFSNMPEFRAAFGCKAGAEMVRPPDTQCQVW